MGFEIGARPEFIRNIVDTYEDVGSEGMEAAVLRIVKELGKGGLVYVPIDKGIEYAESLAKYLKDNGIPAEALHSKKLSSIESFISGELSVLVGVATYYGVLVRGLDLPEIIRYAVFAGPPRHKIGLRLEGVRPQDVLRLLPIVRNAVKDDEIRRKLEASNVRLRRLLARGGQGVIQALNEVISGERKPQTRGEELFLDTYKLIKELLNDREIVESIKSDPNVAVMEEEGELFVLIHDSATYIQASGRTSRLFLGGISKGISVVLVDDPRLLRGLEQRLRWIFDDFTFKKLEDIDLRTVLREIDRDRELIRKIRAGEVPPEISRESPLKLKTALLVVESPNKARTIARFFGRPSMREYGKLRVYEASLGGYTLLITATQGHLYDVVTEINEDGVKHLHGVMAVSYTHLTLPTIA
jgi:reverse gyrase